MFGCQKNGYPPGTVPHTPMKELKGWPFRWRKALAQGNAPGPSARIAHAVRSARLVPEQQRRQFVKAPPPGQELVRGVR